MDSPNNLVHKICSKCNLAKPIDEFNFRNRAKGVRHSYCRDCGKVFTKNHYEHNKQQYFKKNLGSYLKRREFVRQKKTFPCLDCGVQYPYYVMDFDHREGETKKYELNRVGRMTMRALETEIAKCDLVCANCHRERTHQRKLQKAVQS